MAKRFSVGKYVTWRDGFGHSVGRIINVHKQDVDYDGQTYRASAEDPQYEIQCDKGGRRIMQKGAVLKHANVLDRLRQQRHDVDRK